MRIKSRSIYIYIGLGCNLPSYKDNKHGGKSDATTNNFYQKANIMNLGIIKLLTGLYIT